MASIRKRNGRYQAQVRIGSLSKSASFSSKAEARAWETVEEAALYSSLKASGRYVPMDMAGAVADRRSVELVIGSQTLMYGFCVFLPIFLIIIISYFLMGMFFR